MAEAKRVIPESGFGRNDVRCCLEGIGADGRSLNLSVVALEARFLRHGFPRTPDPGIG
jgi:hypothetical protein